MHRSCGTYSGYTIHIRDKTSICNECREASNVYQRSKRTRAVQSLGYDPRRFSRHKITKEYYDTLMSRHDNKCWICKDLNATTIDHDQNCCPQTGSSCGNCVRGVLCHNCNTAIGLLKDRKESILSALEYLS